METLLLNKPNLVAALDEAGESSTVFQSLLPFLPAQKGTNPGN